MRYGEQRVYLIRHGETEWSTSRQHTAYGHSLNENGRAVASSSGGVGRAEFAVVLVSPCAVHARRAN